VLQRLDLATAAMVTLVVGRDCDEATSEAIAERVCRETPHVDVEVIHGDQGTYPLFLAVE
jgi:dihydroxyacetone kinase-like predicted kinase